MHSNHQEYLFQYAPEGSSLYYASLYYPTSIQRFIIALHGFYFELKKIRTQINDPGVARIKLAWWQQEIQEIKQGSSQHPLIRHLSDFTDQYFIDIHPLNQLIEVEESLIQNHFFTEQQKLSAYHKSIGTVWRLCCEASNPLSEDEMHRITKIAIIVECLNDVFNSLENQTHLHYEFSDEYLDSKKINRDSLNTLNVKKKWEQLIKPYIEVQHSQLTALLNNEDEIPDYLFLLVLSRICLAHCKKALKFDMPKFNELLPIKKLFIAWTTYRNLRS